MLLLGIALASFGFKHRSSKRKGVGAGRLRPAGGSNGYCHPPESAHGVQLRETQQDGHSVGGEVLGSVKSS